MAHFAQLNEDNYVIQVIVVANEDTSDQNGIEHESIGINFCKGLLGSETRWVQTSYNSNFRKRYAGIGFRYHEDIDAFVPPKPYPSWVFNNESANWDPPVPLPADNNTGDGTAENPWIHYLWDENAVNWIKHFKTLDSPNLIPA